MVRPTSCVCPLGQDARRESTSTALITAPAWLAWLTELQAALAEEEDSARFAR